ncbi:hypothetical protein N7455_012296 [Penicillium solitum]|uniref:uncharacterized protein n=1 Tax=Penicillium solitum TaxID=60172 RepID=UPI0032C3F6FC|nr:hypothetical protein N7455_012296 [Penicillium solitum]
MPMSLTQVCSREAIALPELQGAEIMEMTVAQVCSYSTSTGEVWDTDPLDIAGLDRDELLELTEINGPHSGENLAEVVLKMLAELDIAPKLLTITGDNAGNNGTLCDSLHDQLLKKYDNDDDRFRIRPLMRFRGRPSFIPCLAYILNLICKDVLASLRAGSAREVKAILDDMAIHTSPAFNSIHSTKGAIIKIRLLTL